MDRVRVAEYAGVPLAAILFGLVAADTWSADFYQNFRGKPVDMQLFQYMGRDAEQWIKLEAEGLRITLPGDQAFTKSVGLTSKFKLKGDFDIITGYELLQTDQPMTGQGVGFEFYLMIDTDTLDAVRFARVMRVKEGDVYQCSRMTSFEGKRQSQHRFFPATARSGQLRLKRVDRDVSFWAAEEDGAVLSFACRSAMRHS
jgi:hypothetical protein